MDPVVLARENDVVILQPRDDQGQTTVGVRPLVDLVGEGDQYAKSQQGTVEIVTHPELFLCLELD